MKEIVFDSGPIISLTMNNLLWLLEPLKEAANARFMITELVKQELVDNPLNRTKRFMFEAMQVLQYIENGTLEIVKVDDDKTKRMLDSANNCFLANGQPMKLVHPAESSAIVLYKQQEAEALVVDERTTRMMIEDPRRLFNILRHRYRYKIEKDKAAIRAFHEDTRKVRVIRSVELVTIAYEKGLLDRYLADIPAAKKRLLESVIWGVKLEGCAVSKKELEQIMRMHAKA